MKIVMKLLEGVFSENSFCEVASFEYVKGSQESLYFRLTQEKSSICKDCDHVRYLPKSTPAPTLTIKFDSIESERVVTKVATMPFPLDDRSIWKVDLIPTDTISGIASATLTEGSKITQISLKGRLFITTPGDNQIC